MSKGKSIRISIYLPPAYAAELARLAGQTRQAKSKLVCEWIALFGDVGGAELDVDLTGETGA